MITPENLREELKRMNVFVTVEQSQSLSGFVAHQFMSSTLIAPVVLQTQTGNWLEQPASDIKPGYFVRRARLMFIEDIPQPVPVLDLVKYLESLSDEASKQYARRLRSAGFES